MFKFGECDKNSENWAPKIITILKIKHFFFSHVHVIHLKDEDGMTYSVSPDQTATAPPEAV